MAGAAACSRCSAGHFGLNCSTCDFGQFRAGNDEDSSVCDECPKGWHQNVQGQAGCLPCVPGRFQDQLNQTECKLCDPGHFSNKTELTICFRCEIGKEAPYYEAAACQSCAAGKYGANCSACDFGQFRAGDDEDSSVCDDCPKGWHQNAQGQAGCLPCVPGSYSAKPRQENCVPCAAGKFSEGLNATECKVPDDGYVAGPSKAGQVAVAVGWQPICTGNDDDKVCTGTSRCDAGTFEQNHVCVPCDPGTSSTEGSTKCEDCDPGRYASTAGSSTCTKCGDKQYAPEKKSTSCKTCGIGRISTGTDCLEAAIDSQLPVLSNVQVTVDVEPADNTLNF